MVGLALQGIHPSLPVISPGNTHSLCGDKQTQAPAQTKFLQALGGEKSRPPTAFREMGSELLASLKQGPAVNGDYPSNESRG